MKSKPIDIFSFSDYKKYLSEILVSRSQFARGQRLRLSEHLRCRPSFVSQVLNEHLDFSAEQAQMINEFLGHSDFECRYFINLIHFSRAGTESLKRFYQAELNQLIEERSALKSRVKANRTLNERDQAIYYSSWQFAAIHVLISLIGFGSKEKIADALELPLRNVSEALEFLMEIGILKFEHGNYKQGETNLFLSKDSPFVTRHLLNWRVQALKSLDLPKKTDLHYSGVITCSNSDVLKIREILTQTIEKVRATVRESKDETLFVYNLDLFGLLKE